MAKSAILSPKASEIEIDVFSNKSALVLFWLIACHEELKTKGFSINEMARQTDLSVGLVHKVVHQLEDQGVVLSQGLRTRKTFHLKAAEKLLQAWVARYSLLKKTKTMGLSLTSSQTPEWKKIGLWPALHTAASELFQLKTTNLRTMEYYLPNWNKLEKVVDTLKARELDRGYELLLIKPYYSALLNRVSQSDSGPWLKAYYLLTILDLCHFPLRGIEQAESLYRKADFLKTICPWNSLESSIE
ncbi:MAG: hypothetical protein KF802_16175 [Bdellovibrionaceae bacterium]|nr:hypothetical protein [Pseudobdellovibrionaceae bacterium]